MKKRWFEACLALLLLLGGLIGVFKQPMPSYFKGIKTVWWVPQALTIAGASFLLYLWLNRKN